MFSGRSLFNKKQDNNPDQEGRCSMCGGDLYTHRE
jgi:hypothetical protein